MHNFIPKNLNFKYLIKYLIDDVVIDFLFS